MSLSLFHFGRFVPLSSSWDSGHIDVSFFCSSLMFEPNNKGPSVPGSLLREEYRGHRSTQFSSNFTSILTAPSYHPLTSFQNGLGCTLLQHSTSPALLTSPTPRQSELVCGACIGTAQIGASLVAPLEFIFKRSSLRSFRDMIIISSIYTLLLTTSRWKVKHQPGVSPYPSCLYAPNLLSFFTEPMRLMRERLPRLG